MAERAIRSVPEPVARRVRPGSRARVDVVMPYYNHGVFIDEAVASLHRQQYPVHRIIIVDDGSTDPYSLEVLDRLEAESRVDVLHQENSGPERGAEPRGKTLRF